MPKTLPQMRLSRDEDLFLRRWMYDEVHYQEGQGPAKRLQIQHQAMPADLAVIVAAGIPDLVEQERIAGGAPSISSPAWPWSDEEYRSRLAEARRVLSERRATGSAEQRMEARVGTIGIHLAREVFIAGTSPPALCRRDDGWSASTPDRAHLLVTTGFTPVER